MIKIRAVAAAVSLLVLGTANAPLFGGGACGPGPCAPPPVAFEEKVVTCYKPEWREREEVCCTEKVVLHSHTTPQKYTVKIPVFTDQTRVCTVLTRVAHETVRQETCTRTVPVCVKDPCTGCTRTEYRTETYVKPVKCTVWESVPVQKAVTEKVCTGWKTEERTRDCVSISVERRPATETKKVPYFVMVPHQVTIKVPVPVPGPACAH
jgi:hypothetical protein